MANSETMAKRLGLTAHPYWNGNEPYWCGRLAGRIMELEALAKECREHIGNRYAEDAAMQSKIDSILDRAELH